MIEKSNSFKLSRHLLFWIALSIYIYIFDPIKGVFFEEKVAPFLVIPRYPIIYYIEYCLLYPKFYTKKKLLAGCLLLLFCCYYLTTYSIFALFLQWYDIEFFSADKLILLVSNLVLFGIITTMSLGMYHKKLTLNYLIKQNKKERALIFKELSFIKNQWNSKITFNFLNYCYEKVQPVSVETAEAIKIFSKMLDYSLTKSSIERVPLGGEVQYINDFIKLQKLLCEGMNVEFTSKGNIYEDVFILPRILIVFVENAFKHGNVFSKTIPIKIELEYTASHIMFKVSNEKGNAKTEISGIGHENLKQHLDIHYWGKYSLVIDQNATIYSTILKLNVNLNSASSEKTL